MPPAPTSCSPPPSVPSTPTNPLPRAGCGSPLPPPARLGQTPPHPRVSEVAAAAGATLPPTPPGADTVAAGSPQPRGGARSGAAPPPPPLGPASADAKTINHGSRTLTKPSKLPAEAGSAAPTAAADLLGSSLTRPIFGAQTRRPQHRRPPPARPHSHRPRLRST